MFMLRFGFSALQDFFMIVFWAAPSLPGKEYNHSNGIWRPFREFFALKCHSLTENVIVRFEITWNVIKLFFSINSEIVYYFFLRVTLVSLKYYSMLHSINSLVFCSWFKTNFAFIPNRIKIIVSPFITYKHNVKLFSVRKYPPTID